MKCDSPTEEVLELLKEASEVIGGMELSGAGIHNGMIPLICRTLE